MITKQFFPAQILNCFSKPRHQSLRQIRSFHIPSIEKMLVDLFAEKKLLHHFQGSDLIHICENAITNYAVNFTKLFSYAKRRGRDREIKHFFTNHMSHLVKDIIND